VLRVSVWPARPAVLEAHSLSWGSAACGGSNASLREEFEPSILSADSRVARRNTFALHFNLSTLTEMSAACRGRSIKGEIMPTALTGTYTFVRSRFCAVTVMLGIAACASQVAPTDDDRAVAVIGQALTCSVDFECLWTDTPICEGGQCVECTVSDHCWPGQVCSNNQCTMPSSARALYETCEASPAARGNCDSGLICLAVGGPIPHCLPAAPCASNADLVFGMFCADTCEGGQSSGGFIEGASCPARAPKCWENNFSEPSNDGWCIP
jgi:hypothetical protein